MRPQSFDDMLGHADLVGPDAAFRRAAEAGQLRSAILWGPPGSGKTTLALCVAATGRYRFQPLSAVFSGVKELKELVAGIPALEARPTLLFVDEIHRWNKAQQDALLPHVESGRLVLLGATTENPSFYLIPALRSRTELLVLDRASRADVLAALRRALDDPKRGLAGVEAEEAALQRISAVCDGDIRRALGLLEGLALRGPLTLPALEALGTSLFHDRDGDAHYDVVSAFIKSMRGSDPDAALYWMARMLEAGEDPAFVARRMVIFAAEDIGNAEPRALQIAVSAMDACARIGMPEARIILAQACTWLASAPKSNASYVAIEAALSAVRREGALPVPLHLRNAPTGLAKQLGHGAEYRYPHEYPNHIVAQTYLPEALLNARFYEPGQEGAEKAIAERLVWSRKRRSSD